MADDTDPQVKLRFEFVELLFALATAEIALQFGELAALHVSPLDAPTSYLHLILAGALVAASWVGWSSSRAPGNRVRITGVFSWAFVVLVIDVTLVIAYFIIVRGVEKATKTAAGVVSVEPSAEKETFWVMAVFLIYVVWDFFTKAVIAIPESRITFWRRLSGRTFWERGWISVTCGAAAVVTWMCLHAVKGVARVVAADIALLSLVLLFRALKEKAWVGVALCGFGWFGAFVATRVWK